MDPALLGLWGVATGVAYALVGHRVDQGPRGANREHPRERAQDFCAIAWYGLAATSFLLAAYAGALWAGSDDLALLATVRLGLVLTFVLALAALLAAAGHLVMALRSRRAARDPSPHPQG